MNGRFKSTSSEKFGSAGPTMAMEVPAPPQGVIGSVCGWLYGVFGPGNIKQDHIRTLIGEMMTVSPLQHGRSYTCGGAFGHGARR